MAGEWPESDRPSRLAGFRAREWFDAERVANAVQNRQLQSLLREVPRQTGNRHSRLAGPVGTSETNHLSAHG